MHPAFAEHEADSLTWYPSIAIRGSRMYRTLLDDHGDPVADYKGTG